MSTSLLDKVQDSTRLLASRIPEPDARVRFNKRIFAATLVTAVLLLLALEVRSPYYFLQDDALEYFLPDYVHNWRSLSSAELPLYNFHTFAGIPHASLGQPASFYVLPYLALFLSKSIWGHVFATLDLLAIMHILLAVAGGYMLLQELGATDTVAAFGALTALSGFLVWQGRMWPFLPALCAWFPWMLWASLRYLAKPTAVRASWLVFFRLGLLYAGYPQFFVLATIFEHLFTLGCMRIVRRDGGPVDALRYVALDVPTALIGLPFLLPMWAEAGRSLARSRPLAYADFSALHVPWFFWLFGQLFVFVNLRIRKDLIGATLPYLSYIGYVPALLSLGGLELWRKKTRSRPLLLACALCILLSLLWCWNVLGPVIYHVPVLNRFRWPFKLLYFAGFFQCLIAALVLGLHRNRWQRIAIVGLVVNWIIVFCFLPSHAWRVHEYHPPLRSPWQDELANGRYAVIIDGDFFSAPKQFVEFNYSVLWGLDNLAGYEPMLSQLAARVAFGNAPVDLRAGGYRSPVDPALLDHFKRWSVKYVLVSPDRADASAKLADAGFQRSVARGGWILWRDPNWLPRVRWAGAALDRDARAGIRWVEHPNSIDVFLGQWPGQQLLLAFAANPGLEACLDSRCRPVATSPDGMIRLDVPPGTSHVQLVYHNELFRLSAFIALATLAVFTTLMLWRTRRRKS
jgi:hypothetical protein